MFQMKKTVIALVASSALLTACATDGWGNKQSIGTGVGAVLGAVVGSQFGSGSGSVAAGVLGAVIGGALGNWIGSNLDERDQRALAIKSQEALESGKTVTWKSDHSGASATIRPSQERVVRDNARLRRATNIETVHTLHALNRPYQAKRSANLRSGPSTNSEIVGGFKVGQTFTALGRTENNWIAVGRQGVIVGYVHAPLVGEVRANTKARERVASQGVDLDQLTVAQARQQGFDLDAIDVKQAQTDRVTVERSCRTVEYDLTTQQGSESRKVEACQGLDGAWQLG